MHARLAASLWFAAGLLGACGSASIDSDFVPEATPPRRAALTTPAILYLDFDGLVVTKAAVDDATQNASQLGATQVPPFSQTVGAPKVSRDDAIRSIVDRVRSYYQPFDVQVVTSRPPTGPYTLVAIGGSHGLLGAPLGVVGLSTLDCTNANPSNIVFNFSDDITPSLLGVIGVAYSIAHETGHSFGLEHTDNPNDIMYSVARPMVSLSMLFSLSFTSGNYSGYNGASAPLSESCGRADPVDNHSLLLDRFGARTLSDATPPTLSFTYPPPEVSQVPTHLSIGVAASDEVGVVRLEVYRSAELVAVVSAPPWRADLDLANGRNDVTVEAIDAAANRTAVTRSFVASTTTAAIPACSADSCPTGSSCIDGVCSGGAGAHSTAPGGCSWVGPGSSAPGALAVLLTSILFVLGARRRNAFIAPHRPFEGK